MSSKLSKPSRRHFLAAVSSAALSAGGAVTLAGCVTRSGASDLEYPFGPVGADVDDSFAPSVMCIPGQSGSSELAEGPFYTPNTPRRRSFLDDAAPGAEQVRIVGRVLNTDCAPIVGAVIDLWHCDEQGVYDQSGLRFRGHQYTDDDGEFELITAKPALYTDGTYRSPHVHVKLQGPDTRLLTSQVFFPEDGEDHARDSLFDPTLVAVHVGDSENLRVVHFDFVLSLAE